MSLTEREHACVVRQVALGQIGQKVAAERLGIGVRQMKRLMRLWRTRGDSGLVSHKAGTAFEPDAATDFPCCPGGVSSRPISGFWPNARGRKAIGTGEFHATGRNGSPRSDTPGPVAPEKAEAEAGVPASRTPFPLRRTDPDRRWPAHLVREPGSALRADRVHRRRDATSRLTALCFVPVESPRAYLEALRDQVLAHGRPLAFCSDRHGIFRVNAKDARSGDGKTGFGRVAERLGIEPIHALTPQAKGRVERANQTSQDRMVKEMRLHNICSIEVANGFSSAFIAF